MMITRALWSLLAVGALAVTNTASLGAGRAPETEALVARAGEAHARLMAGDIDGYRRAVDLAPDFILMDPFGGRPSGVPASEAHWERIGRFFRAGTNSAFDRIATFGDENLIVLVGNERAHVTVGSLPPQDWTLRVTLVFRRDDGAWRLVHRHADPLALGITLEQAGQLARGFAAAGPAK